MASTIAFPIVLIKLTDLLNCSILYVIPLARNSSTFVPVIVDKPFH